MTDEARRPFGAAPDDDSGLPDDELREPGIVGGGVMGEGGTAVDRGTGTMADGAQGPLADDDEGDAVDGPAIDGDVGEMSTGIRLDDDEPTTAGGGATGSENRGDV